MRMAAFAGLAITLVLAAALLLTGSPQLSIAEASSPLAPREPAQGQTVDEVSIEMLLNGQPESLFPGEVLDGTTVVVPGTRSVSGRVHYNTVNNGTPVPRLTTIRVLDPAGIEVYRESFTTSTNPGTRDFSVTGDQMMTIYRQISNDRIATAKTKADALQVATDSLVTDTITALTDIATAASEADAALGRILSFTEVVTPARTSLAQAQAQVRSASSTADNLARQGIALPARCQALFPGDPVRRQQCLDEVTQRVSVYNSNLPGLKTAINNAQAAYNEAAATLGTLSNLKIPPIDSCATINGRPVPRTYDSSVSQLVQIGQDTVDTFRDSWEWQVGTSSSFKHTADIVVSPSQIYMLSVTASPIHSALVEATLYDLRCLPVSDGVEVNFRTSIGSVDPITVTTFSEAGVHGLARTTLSPGTGPGPGAVSIAGIPVQANVTVIGPAYQMVFLSTTGEQQTARYIRQGEQVDLQVQVRDQVGSIVADGTQVEFTVTNNAGQFNQSIVTTVNGLALVRFTAGQTSLASAEVTARAIGTQASARLTIAIVGPPTAIQIGVAEGYSTTLYINSRSDDYPNFTFVEAVVSDAGGSPVADGTQVRFRLTTANRAFWENPEPSGNGLTTIVTTAGGRARAKLQVPDSENPVRNTVNVQATVVGDNAPIPAVTSQLLTITLSDELPVIRTEYKIFMPLLLDNARCGRAGGGGCSGGAP